MRVIKRDGREVSFSPARVRKAISKAAESVEIVDQGKIREITQKVLETLKEEKVPVEKIQDKIDAYAMAEGLTSTSDYAAQYKRGDWIEREGAPDEVADALLSQLEAEFAKVEIPRR